MPLSQDQITALQEFLKFKRFNTFGEPSGVMCNETYRAYRLYLQSIGKSGDDFNVSELQHLSVDAQSFIASATAKVHIVPKKDLPPREEKLPLEKAVEKAVEKPDYKTAPNPNKPSDRKIHFRK